MTLTQDQPGDPTITDNVTIDQLQKAIDSIDGQHISFIVLENTKGDYLQCAGTDSHLTVEFRQNFEDRFKHYVLGPKKENKSPLDVTWSIIECKVGPIHVHDSEVLNKDDVKTIFGAYLSTGVVSAHLNLRNVTKKFVENGS